MPFCVQNRKLNLKISPHNLKVVGSIPAPATNNYSASQPTGFVFVRMGTMESLSVVIFTLVVIGVIFLIARELWCWYWKINTIIEKLNEISEKLDNK